MGMIGLYFRGWSVSFQTGFARRFPNLPAIEDTPVTATSNMLDPLTATVTIASIVQLGCTIAKKLYSFVISVVDAPEEIRSLVSGLYSLNTSLCQIQTLLMNPSFSDMHSTEQLNGLQEVLTNCGCVYDQLQSRANKAGKSLEGMGEIKKLWIDVKWVFQEDKLDALLLSLESEKNSLILIINTLTMFVPWPPNRD